LPPGHALEHLLREAPDFRHGRLAGCRFASPGPLPLLAIVRFHRAGTTIWRW
jgi:hypothetical protein